MNLFQVQTSQVFSKWDGAKHQMITLKVNSICKSLAHFGLIFLLGLKDPLLQLNPWTFLIENCFPCFINSVYISDLVDPTLSSLSVSCEESYLKSQSYGWALIGGGSADTLADYLGEGRTLLSVLTMPDVIYSYGYNMGYALGFAGPFLLPTYLGSCNTDCSSADFTSLAHKYGFTQGLQGQYIGESKIHNFGLDAKEALGCLIQQKGESKEAAQVDYLIDDLVDAGVQVIKLEKKLNLV